MNEQDRKQMELRAAGWESKKRGQKTIWESPDNGFYYSQEMAIEIVREGAKPSTYPGVSRAPLEHSRLQYRGGG
jgi:hypothetical protein